MKPQAIIFDIDGTLWDSTDLVAAGYNRYLAANGLTHLQVTGAVLKKLFGRTMQDIADALFAGLPVPRRYEVLEGCMASGQELMAHDPCDVAYPGIRQTMERLAGKYRLFIVSNCEKGYPELTMEKLGIAPYVEGHLCYGDTKAHKGRTIRLLMERYGVEDAVYVGDTQGDLEASRMAGIPFVFCRYGFGTPESWEAAIDSFAQLLPLMEL